MNYLFIVTKIIIIYFFLIVIFRFLGKREVGELSIFDLVILLIIADIASLGIDNQEFFFPSLICLLVLAVLQKVLSICLLHIAGLRSIVDGSPTIIVYDGVIKYDNMKKELYTMDDLVFQMHQNHIETISEIRLAILETNGTLSIFRASRFDIPILPIIVSGKIVKENLEELSISEDIVNSAFSKKSLSVKKVIYADYQAGKIDFYYKKNNKIKDLKKETIVLKGSKQ
ncbi:MAG: DUF421 domain-containing protein [Anaeroplasma sp.]